MIGAPFSSLGMSMALILRVGGVLLLELGESDARRPGPGGPVGLSLPTSVHFGRRSTGQDSVVTIGEQGRIVVRHGAVHDQHDGLDTCQALTQLTRPWPSSVPT